MRRGDIDPRTYIIHPRASVHPSHHIHADTSQTLPVRTRSWGAAESPAARSATNWTARWARSGMGDPANPALCERWCMGKVDDKSWPWMCTHFARCQGCAHCHVPPHFSKLDHEGLPVTARSLQLPEHLDRDQYANMHLQWNDEFDECPDGRPDPMTWRYERGYIRNHEMQYYREEDATCSDGTLTITARKHPGAGIDHPHLALANASRQCHVGLWEQPDWCKEARESLHYTSSSMESNQDRTGLLLRGQYDARIRIPLAGNAWPAFWAVGSNSGRMSTWPQDGEIDIMECARSICSPTRNAHSAPLTVPDPCALHPSTPQTEAAISLRAWSLASRLTAMMVAAWAGCRRTTTTASAGALGWTAGGLKNFTTTASCGAIAAWMSSSTASTCSRFQSSLSTRWPSRTIHTLGRLRKACRFCSNSTLPFRRALHGKTGAVR